MVLSHTLTLIFITVLVSMLAWSHPRVMNRLVFWSPAIQKGQFDRFITYGFVHSNFMHLLFNMVTLYFFGQAIERFYRQFAFDMGFALFYIGALMIAILPSYWSNRNNPQWASLGASGAISAILFAFVLFSPWSLIWVFFVPMPAIVFAILYVGYTLWAQRRYNSGINHSAHLWGAIYGVVMTMILQPSLGSQFAYRLLHPQFGG